MGNEILRSKVLIALLFLIFQQSVAFSDVPERNEMAALDRYYSLLNRGDQFASTGQTRQALACYQAALGMAKNADGEGVARGTLLRFYENTGAYEAAFNETEWFLKRNLTAPGRVRYEAIKQRLLRKIEAQKRGQKVETAKVGAVVIAAPPIKKIADFQAADYGSQKRFLEKELPGNTNVLRLSKQALLAEHSGDFGPAKECYEKLLIQKDGVIAAQGEVAWVMLHPAVQRTSEVTGDEVLEKQMLVWISDNMLPENGVYHKYLGGLLPPVRDHLNERFKKFDIGT